MGRPPKVKMIEDAETVKVSASNKDDLAVLIQKNLTKELKNESLYIGFLDEPEEAPTTVTDWISTGNSLLDLAISNRPNGGMPCGKQVELNGLEACVTEDTLIDIIISNPLLNSINPSKEITIGEV